MEIALSQAIKMGAHMSAHIHKIGALGAISTTRH
jgi:hypothetical protein